MRIALLALAACSADPPVDAPREPFCGDGVLDPGEGCDDANAIDGDGCDRSCQSEVVASAIWTFYPMLDGPAGPCRANAVEVEVFAESGAMGKFPCEAGRGDMSLTRQAERVFARAIDANGNVIVTSLPRFPTVRYRVELAFYEDAGFVRTFSERMPCMLAPAPAMRVTDSSGAVTVKMFPNCGSDIDVANGVLVSDPLRAGTYDVTVTTQTGVVYTRTGVVVGANNAVTDLDLTAP